MNKYFTLLKNNIFRIKNISLYFSASFIQGLVSLAINPLIAMNMSHYDYALTGFYTSFNSLLLPLLNLMFGQYFNRHYFKLNSDEERDELAARLVSTRLIFNLFEIIFILIVFHTYAKIQNIEFPIYPYAIITFSTIIFNNIFDFYLLKLKMGKRASSFFKISIINTALLSGLSLILVVGFKLGALGKLGASLLTSVILFTYLLPKLTKKIIIDKKIFIDALKFTWPLILAASSGYFLRGFDRALLVSSNDNVQFGLYNVAIGISGYLNIIQNSLQQTFQPDIFEAAAKDNKKKLIGITCGMNLLNIIPVLVFILFSPFIVKILTADKFTNAYIYVRILALANISMNLAYSMTGIFIAYGLSFLSMYSEIIGAILNIILLKILISKYSFYGAAWGQVLSYFLILTAGIIGFLIYKKILKHK